MTLTLILWSGLWLPMPSASALVTPLTLWDLQRSHSLGVQIIVTDQDGQPQHVTFQVRLDIKASLNGPWMPLERFGPAVLQGNIWMTWRRPWTSYSIELPRSLPQRLGKIAIVWLRVRGYPESEIPLFVTW